MERPKQILFPTWIFKMFSLIKMTLSSLSMRNDTTAPCFSKLGLHVINRVLRQVSLVLYCVLRLSEKLQKMTLTSQSEEPSEAGKELKLSVNQEEMEIITKGPLQVLTGTSNYHTNRITIVHIHFPFSVFKKVDLFLKLDLNIKQIS